MMVTSKQQLYHGDFQIYWITDARARTRTHARTHTKLGEELKSNNINLYSPPPPPGKIEIPGIAFVTNQLRRRGPRG